MKGNGPIASGSLSATRTLTLASPISPALSPSVYKFRHNRVEVNLTCNAPSVLLNNSLGPRATRM
jgi:hypothetical protein